jgi:hypothetical protein
MDNQATEYIGPGMGDHEGTNITELGGEDPEQNSGYHNEHHLPHS